MIRISEYQQNHHCSVNPNDSHLPKLVNGPDSQPCVTVLCESKMVGAPLALMFGCLTPSVVLLWEAVKCLGGIAELMKVKH